MAIWLVWSHLGTDREAINDRFASLYAGTAVVAELYRNEPERFVRARDSLYRLYDFTPQAVDLLKQKWQGREEEWYPIWVAIKRKTDSLTQYYKDHPVSHPIAPKPDSGLAPADFQ